MAEIDELILRDVRGAREVIAWFGYWPSFHDAEVVSVLLSRDDESRIDIHTFNTSPEVNETGHYKTTNHAIVSFIMKDMQAMELTDFNHQNVLSCLVLSRVEDGFKLELGCCYGLCGSLQAASIRIEILPGLPSGSVYKETTS